MEKIWTGKEVKIILIKDDRYYRGLVLSEGEQWIRIRDVRGQTVLINFEYVKFIEEVKK